MNTKSISISDYNYDLPEERIAKFPLEQRDASKLLIWKNGTIEESVYRSISNNIPEGSLLFFNETKVIRARMIFKNSTGGKIEVFCLDPYRNRDVSVSMAAQGKVEWNCLIGGLSKWTDDFLQLEHHGIVLEVRRIGTGTDHHPVEFRWNPAGKSFAEILDAIGSLPIPPYLKRETEEIDLNRYQTVYAKNEGSVAAPTAGLHFTPFVFDELKKKNCQSHFVTLHVGAGTFKPVKSATMAEHVMHAEVIDVSLNTISRLAEQQQKMIVAVGTTTTRTLESLYWMGIKLLQSPEIKPDDLFLGQWECYEAYNNDITLKEALSALIDWLRKNGLDRLIAPTSIMIAPGYCFRIVNALVTNFHQPGSTLILLVAAIAGEEWKTIYNYALQNDFRFLSYGDGSLLFVQNNR